MYYIIQPPMFMEDSGRSIIVSRAKSEAEAELQIEEIVKMSNGFYSRCNFVIAKAQVEF